MDNNAAERALRGPVIGRRLSFGSDSETGALFTALMYSVVGTLATNGINVRHWLEAWLRACAANGGRAPQDLSPWLPWSMNEERKRAPGNQQGVGDVRDRAAPCGPAGATAPARRKARSQASGASARRLRDMNRLYRPAPEGNKTNHRVRARLRYLLGAAMRWPRANISNSPSTMWAVRSIWRLNHGVCVWASKSASLR